MSQSLIKIYLHIVFSTKYRKPMMDDAIENELFDYLGGICKELECNPLQVGGYRDHVHILCRFSKKITLIKLIEEVKRSSSKWIKSKGKAYSNFYWQGGYAAFSVNPAEIERVIEYIKNQKAHHEKASYQDECRAFFKRYRIEYDERYVWD